MEPSHSFFSNLLTKSPFEVALMKILKSLISFETRETFFVSLLVFVAVVVLGILGTVWYFDYTDPIHASVDIAVADNLDQGKHSESIPRNDFGIETREISPWEGLVGVNALPKNPSRKIESDPYRLSDLQASLEQDRRAKMWSIVDSLGFPSMEDKGWLEADRRNQDVSEMLAESEAKLGRPISEEVKALLLESARRMWYRMDRLIDMYNSGEIGYLEYGEGLARISMLNRQEEGDILSDEEFAAYNGELKSESVFLTDSSAYDPSILSDATLNSRGVTVLPERDAEFFALFSGIQKDYPEIRTLDDLSQYVSEASVDVAVATAREFVRTENELWKALREGRITEEAYRVALIQAREKAKQDTSSSLSSTEQEFLFKKRKD